ncbi:Uncharacterised protein [uncultured archaeon]|nr:Uncharacterised protein [uncultured archaeon]
MLNNKRGNLLSEETLKIVIAVICIIFLVSLLLGIYNSYTTNREAEMAKSTLSKFNEAVSLKHETFDVFNPTSGSLNKFYLVAWAEGGPLPTSCSNVGWASCVCICRTSYSLGIKDLLGNIIPIFRTDVQDNLLEECPKWSCTENKEKVFLYNLFEELKSSPTYLQMDYSDPTFVGVSKK